MPDDAQVNRSISTVRTELDHLRDAGVLMPPQLESIMAQLPKQGKPSPYVDPRYAGGPGAPQWHQIAQNAQNKQNPEHPDHPKHHEWAKNMASRFGSAVMFGAGATFGGDMVNDALKHV